MATPLLENFLRVCLFLILMAVVPLPAAADWRVIPIRLDFDQKSRSGVVTLANDGDEAISFSVDAVEWLQDNSGQDRYNPTEELVFFPKVITVPAKQERVVRAGIKAPAIQKEKTYRLFIKETAGPRKAEGTAVAIAIQFGVPIFAKPALEEIKGELSAALLDDGQKVNISIVNTGNVHFRISTITLSGKDFTGNEVLNQVISGWYLLAGAKRMFTSPIQADICRKLKTLDIEMKADHLTLSKKIDVDPAMCAAP